MVCADCLSCILSHDKLDVIWGAAEHDPVYNTLYHPPLSRWLNCLKQVPRTVHHFWGTWDELSIEDDNLLKGEHVCVPLISSTGPWLTSTAHTREWKNVFLDQRGSLLAWHQCRHHWLHHEVPNIHQTQSIPASPAHASLRHHWQPMAGDHSWWFQAIKVKITSSSTISSASNPSYTKLFPSQPFPFSKTYKSSLPNTDPWAEHSFGAQISAWAWTPA